MNDEEAEPVKTLIKIHIVTMNRLEPLTVEEAACPRCGSQVFMKEEMKYKGEKELMILCADCGLPVYDDLRDIDHITEPVA